MVLYICCELLGHLDVIIVLIYQYINVQEISVCVSYHYSSSSVGSVSV